MTYQHVWPATDPTQDIRDLATVALPELRYAIAADGLTEVGPPHWSLRRCASGSTTLVVQVPVARPRGAKAREIDDNAVAHLLRDGVSIAQIAAMTGCPQQTVELAALRVRHRSNVECDPTPIVYADVTDEGWLESEFDRRMDDLGLSDHDRQVSGRSAVA